MPELRLVTVRPDGSAGVSRGTLAFDGAAITAEDPDAEGLLETLRRHSRLTDPQLWQWLLANGWSNGHLMIDRP